MALTGTRPYVDLTTAEPSGIDMSVFKVVAKHFKFSIDVKLEEFGKRFQWDGWYGSVSNGSIGLGFPPIRNIRISSKINF